MDSEKANFPNRQNQREMLEKLMAGYPDLVDVQSWKYPNLSAELHYLHEHELAQVTFSSSLGYPTPKPITAKLTAKGVDFLQQDGGLSAILGTVTIKLHDDTIKVLIESKIMASNLSQPDKRRYLDALRELPAETTKHLVLKLVDMGLERKEAAVSVIGSLMGLS